MHVKGGDVGAWVAKDLAHCSVRVLGEMIATTPSRNRTELKVLLIGKVIVSKRKSEDNIS